MSKTIQELARDAINVQDACNLVAVARSFSEAVRELRDLVPSGGSFGRSFAVHPITYLWVNKIGDLSGQSDLSPFAIDRFGEMYRACEAIARGEPRPTLPVPSEWDAVAV